MSEARRYLTVSQLNEYVKMLMDSDEILSGLWVKGEISNFTNHRTGHFYFSLKDESALVRCVMFKGYTGHLQFLPKEGMRVLLHGRVSAFVRDGQYQIYVDDIVPEGIGSLYAAFEQLKAKLQGEGLFDESRKRPLPAFPERIGIVTSPTGAAIRDMINILGRRFPLAEIILYPALVQGPEAPGQIVKGIRYFNENHMADVLIVGRGGGSLEDLWAFNNETLARAVAASNIPVISAVGHETDFTICDFVADLRAPTPSAAAELAVPDKDELAARLTLYRDKLYRCVAGKVDTGRRMMKMLSETGVLESPEALFSNRRMALVMAEKSMDTAMKATMTKAKSTVEQAAGKLEALSPLGVLARGYALAENEEGNVIRKIKDTDVGKDISILVSDGRIVASVTEKIKEKRHGQKTNEL